MGILDLLGFGKDIAAPINAVGTLYTTEKEKLNAQAEVIKAVAPIAQAQLENNRSMILSGSRFLSDWIALLGYTMGFCVALYWIPQLIVDNYLWAEKCLRLHQIFPFPIADTSIMQIVALLFGTGLLHKMGR